MRTPQSGLLPGTINNTAMIIHLIVLHINWEPRINSLITLFLTDRYRHYATTEEVITVYKNCNNQHKTLYSPSLKDSQHNV